MNHTCSIHFEWDEAKSEACFAQLGFDYAYVLQTFLDTDRLIRKDTRWDYGEDRYQLLGAIDHRVFFVVYTLRGATIRIVSARKANQREITDYENSTQDN